MAIIRMPTLDSRGNGDEGIAPIEAYVDTSTGQVLNRVRQGDSENGFTYAMQPTGKTWEFANKAGANGQMIYGSQGYSAPTFQDQGDGSFNSMGAGGDTPNGMHQIGDNPQLVQYLQQRGANPTYDPKYGMVVSSKDWSTLGPDYRNSIYTGGDPMSDFLGSYGVPLLMAGVGGLAAMGAGGAGLGAAEMGSAPLQAIYGTGAGGFGAPAAGLLESVTPTISGLEAAGGVGSLGSLTGTGGLTPLSDAASLGAGTGGSPIVGSNGITGSISELNNAITPQVAGTSTTAPDAFSNGFNPSDPSTWPNISTQNGTGFTPSPDVPAPNLSAPTTDAFGNPLSGQTYNLGNSGTGMTNLNTSTFGGNDPFGNWLKQQMSSPTSSLKNLTSSKSGITNPDGSINWGNLISGGLTAAGGLATYNRQNQLWDSGADSRARFNNAMTPGFDLSTMPGYKSALDTSSDAFTRSLSAKQGNPAGTGSAQAETQKYLMGTVGLPYLSDYEKQNAAVGWNPASLGTSTAPSDLSGSLGKATALLTPNTGQADISSQVGNLSQLTDYLKQAGVKVGDLFTAWGN